MKTYRVGTISIGILFIFLGIGMLTNQFYDGSFVNVVFNWWPILLILLGTEILLYLWRRKANAENPKLSYDLASIFIIFVFGMVSIGLYTIQETGVLKVIQTNLQMKNYDIQTSPMVIDDVRGISTIKVIGNPMNLNLLSSEETMVTMYGSWDNIYAENEEKAHQLTSELLETERNGDTLFITINKPVSENTFAHSSSTNGYVTLYIPSTIDIDTDVEHSSINVHVEKLTSSWNIRSISGSISAQIEDKNDIKIQATTLQGHLREDTPWTSINEHNTKGNLTIGEGTYKLHLFTEHGRIEVNH
jgi:hypothetical protein